MKTVYSYQKNSPQIPNLLNTLLIMANLEPLKSKFDEVKKTQEKVLTVK